MKIILAFLTVEGKVNKQTFYRIKTRGHNKCKYGKSCIKKILDLKNNE